MSNEFKVWEEWFKQADYDLDTAQTMLDSRRYHYAIFMAHLAVEKSLKGRISRSGQVHPPKTHDLHYLCSLLKIPVPEAHQEFIDGLNDLSVPIRYPENLESLLSQFGPEQCGQVLTAARSFVQWIKQNEYP
jgi:HEPN domain-containing protein